MTDTLLARKGQAVPTVHAHGDRHARDHAVRRLIAHDRVTDTAAASLTRPEGSRLASIPRAGKAARLLPRGQRVSTRRRRFTFRLPDQEHLQFCAAATTLGCSRQKLLERALEHYLRAFGLDDDLEPGSASFPRATGPVTPRLV